MLQYGEYRVDLFTTAR